MKSSYMYANGRCKNNHLDRNITSQAGFTYLTLHKTIKIPGSGKDNKLNLISLSTC